MAQGACDGAETTRPDYAFSGGFIGSGPDSARHGSSADGSQSFMRTPVQSGWPVQHDASQNPYGAAHATPQQRMDPFKPDPIFSFGTAPDARFSPPAFQNHFGWPSAYDATQNPSHGGPTATSAPVSGPCQYQYQQQHWSPGGHATPSAYNPATQYAPMGMHAGHDAAQHPISGASMTPLPFDMSVQNLHSQQQMHQWMARWHVRNGVSRARRQLFHRRS